MKKHLTLMLGLLMVLGVFFSSVDQIIEWLRLGPNQVCTVSGKFSRALWRQWVVDHSGTGQLREGDSHSSRPDDVSVRIWRSESEAKAILRSVETVSGRAPLRSPGERISHHSVNSP